MKKLILIMLLFCQVLSAPPGYQVPVILQTEPLNNLEAIWQAVCIVESSNDPLAYCIDVNGLPSVGISQVQASRVDEYNREANDTIKHSDCFNPIISKKVFDHYAKKYNNTEQIIRCWNGGPRGMSKIATIAYFEKVKKYLYD